MKWHREKTSDQASRGFTLAEVLVALTVFILVGAGIMNGYVQANRMAEFSALSLSAQSYAQQGAEQARSANWRPRDFPATDEKPAPTNYMLCGANYIFDVPIKGNPASANFPFFVTNYVSIINVSTNPPLRQIRSDTVWIFYLTGRLYTNTAILLRAPDQ
jgi:prepilin-type N-terminal cleavage/methylation domain-containing protein